MKKSDLVSNLTPEQLAAILNGGFQQSSAMEKFLEKQNVILDEQIALKEEERRILRLQKEQGAREMQKRRDAELMKQEQCPHIKPNRATAIGGQRDHSGNAHYICQICSKEWVGAELPNWLAPDPLTIGGPQL